ncbi:MAG: RluA family pseudouridine synthase [Pseudomonadales bacterium]|nr:RluA family pseudouridine synthase [Pseudomonadales bacterium]
MENIIEIDHQITLDQSTKKASLVLAELSGLSQAQIKEAMSKGAVWVQHNKKRQRLRRASKVLVQGDRLELFYNPAILQKEVPQPQLMADEGDYSIWFKPYGLSCQGSRWGDFSSINRQVEAHFLNARPVFLVHRLDNATSGVMVLAHSKKAAREFSDMFAARKVDKRYQAIVAGDLSSLDDWTEVVVPVDGKSASTLLKFAEIDKGHSLIDVRLNTGRKHQIRQHLASLGHAIIGDRLYGQAQEGDINLQLQARRLCFICPRSQKSRDYCIPEHLRLSLSDLLAGNKKGA